MTTWTIVWEIYAFWGFSATRCDAISISLALSRRHIFKISRFYLFLIPATNLTLIQGLRAFWGFSATMCVAYSYFNANPAGRLHNLPFVVDLSNDFAWVPVCDLQKIDIGGLRESNFLYFCAESDIRQHDNCRIIFQFHPCWWLM